MTRIGDQEFREVWLVDFEFSAPPGERPHPICLVAREWSSSRTLKIWQDKLKRLKEPPYPIGDDCLFVAYYASAELGCHLALEWPLPVNVLDLFVEFRNKTNGKPTPCGAGLLGALTYFGLDGIGTAEKESMQNLAIRGGPWTESERKELLDYCETDVVALARLLPKMLPFLDLPRALLRGRYMKAAARIEHTGVPIDTDALSILRSNWPRIQEELIKKIDVQYGVYEGRRFKAALWEQYLIKKNKAWPRLPSGKIALDDDTFREMARSDPDIAPMRELRVALSQMRLADLAVGSDGRNRCLLSAFRARTSRNQPSNSKFIFGPAVWLRGLIRPAPGFGLAYIDYSQQEFGIAAALSGDEAMMEAYQSGDPYLAFAKQAGAVPKDATKETHRSEREQFKACVLAVQYGMGAKSLSERIGQPEAGARQLLRMHRETYSTFWHWSEAAVDHAMLHGKLWTVFGWEVRVGTQVNPRFLQNFPMQANGAEMLRLACCFATERGIQVCAPVHDALLIKAHLDGLEDAVRSAQKVMSDASEVVLAGFKLRTDAELIRHPKRYEDERGRKMWETVLVIVTGLTSETCAETRTHLCADATIPVHERTPVQSYICI